MKKKPPLLPDGTRSCSLNSACRWLSCIGRLSVDLRQQQHSAALWATKQPSLGTALLAKHGDGAREGGPNKACLTLTWLASRGQRASLPSGKKNERKKTASLKAACWNIHTMQDSEDRSQRRSALVARELARLDINTAVLSEVCFAEQGLIREDKAGCILFWSGKNSDERRLSGVGFMIKTSIAKNCRSCHSNHLMPLRLPVQDKFATVLSVYALNRQAKTGAKEAFYITFCSMLTPKTRFAS